MIESDNISCEEHSDVKKYCFEKVSSFAVTFFKNSTHHNICYMSNSFSRGHIQPFRIDPLNDPSQSEQNIPSDKEFENIHSGFSACKLENQNVFTNITHNTSILPTYRGVTL
jgi:hypothetical protein